MTMKKKILTTLSVVLILGLAALGILAYLQSEDSDVNVMTLGNVSIAQHEYERVQNADGTYEMVTSTKYGEGYKLQEFTQAKPLYPATGAITGWGNIVPFDQIEGASGTQKVFAGLNNVQDKFVLVENTGKSDAYVRTMIALEYGSNTKDIIGISTGDFWTWNDIGIIQIEGNNYYLFEAVYKGSNSRHINGVLPAGEYTYNSLGQVYLKNEATNEDCEALDGNKNGKYDILVLSQAGQVKGFESVGAKSALDTMFGEVNAANAKAWFEGVVDDATADTWDGTVDTSWYNDTDTEFEITTAEQLAGLAELVDGGNTFAGKTVKLGKDIDLYAVDENGNRVCFEPIGDASNADFSGTFDGKGKTIYNLYQDCNSKHVALFGAVYEGTVKNLTLDGARVENDGSGYAGAIAAYAGASSFENITLKDSTVVNYNHNTAGIVAWCSNNGTTTTFDGINIESSTTIGSWWGSYDTRVGGIVGAMNTDNNVVIKNSTVACRLDVYNDACSNYQWYNYRTAGMVVADVRDNHTVDGRTEANPARVTCENVTVIFGDWANYHYCESASYGTPSYADEGEYKFKRVEAGLGYGGVDISACNHAADETHNELIAFDFLFGARDGKGIYGISSFDGVTVVKN